MSMLGTWTILIYLFVVEFTKHKIFRAAQFSETGISVVPAVFTNTVWLATLETNRTTINDNLAFVIVLA
jgi:hypothetical protein